MDDRRSTTTATYVFCLVQSGRAPSLRSVPASLPGAGAPRLIPVDRDIWAVVADAPLERFEGEELQRELQDVEAISRHALAHASVVEFFFRHAPVIPLKLFTLFSSDDAASAHLQSRREELTRMFAGLRGLEEWGVRIVAGQVEAESSRTLSSGRDYLQVKKRLHDETAAPPRSTVRAVDGALKALGRIASKTRKEAFPAPGKGRPYVTGTSFLVKVERRAEWKRAIAKTAAALARQGHHLAMSGPWPPYHFVSS
ncbi:MAG: hypothetical protein EHM55_18720 [Acidobacteria bacterium]|nr:MAG: hypothetical protein EHM55_18720 [Acidobacteriota bacterium]